MALTMLCGTAKLAYDQNDLVLEGELNFQRRSNVIWLDVRYL